MSLKKNIRKIEKSLVPGLEQFFRSVYPDNYLPSHGLDHHRRVWKYAVELLYTADEKTLTGQFIEKLLIGCYLHDSGMAIEKSPRHGEAGRNFCEKYLALTRRNAADYSDLLAAIENHDNKEYPDHFQDNMLYLFLTVADDLDAFGKEGAARYTEIYLARGISPETIAGKSIENAGARFRNFSLHFSRHRKLFLKHRKRYLDLIAELSVSDHMEG